MTTESHSYDTNKQSSSATIGNVESGIRGSTIAGRYVTDVTITLGGQPHRSINNPF
jgi:hypothetical protein